MHVVEYRLGCDDQAAVAAGDEEAFDEVCTLTLTCKIIHPCDEFFVETNADHDFHNACVLRNTRHVK